jgi:hypothetical protein
MWATKPATNHAAASSIRLNREVMTKEYLIALRRSIYAGYTRCDARGDIPGPIRKCSAAIRVPLDPELAELRLQSGTLQAQARGRAVWPAELPAAFPKNLKNALALFVAQLDVLPPIPLIDGLLQFGQRSLQHRTRREYDRTLHEVFQFANVARPIPPHQHFHGA